MFSCVTWIICSWKSSPASKSTISSWLVLPEILISQTTSHFLHQNLPLHQVSAFNRPFPQPGLFPQSDPVPTIRSVPSIRILPSVDLVPSKVSTIKQNSNPQSTSHKVESTNQLLPSVALVCTQLSITLHSLPRLPNQQTSGSLLVPHQGISPSWLLPGLCSSYSQVLSTSYLPCRIPCPRQTPRSALRQGLV